MNLIHVKLKSAIELIGSTKLETISDTTNLIDIKDIFYVQYTQGTDGSMSANLIPFSPLGITSTFTVHTNEFLAHSFDVSTELRDMFVQATTGLELAPSGLVGV